MNLVNIGCKSATKYYPTFPSANSLWMDIPSAYEYKIANGTFITMKTGMTFTVPKEYMGLLRVHPKVAALDIWIQPSTVELLDNTELTVICKNQNNKVFAVTPGTVVIQMMLLPVRRYALVNK